jgi:hypothetical protein
VYAPPSVVSLQNSASSYLAVFFTRTSLPLPLLLHAFTRILWRAWMASRLPSVFSSYLPYLVTKMMSKLTLCFLLCRFTPPTPTTILPLHWHTSVALRPFRYYGKMFVGGLSWDTPDGTLSLPAHLASSFWNVIVHFDNSLNCAVACDPFFHVFLCIFKNQRACRTIFLTLEKSTYVPSFGTQTASRAALLSSRLRTPYWSTPL